MLSKSWQWVRSHWLLLAVVVLLVLVVVWWLPGLFVHDLSKGEVDAIGAVKSGNSPAEVAKAKTDRLNARNNIRATLLQSLGGAALLVGLFFTARQIRLTQEEGQRITQEGQLETARLTSEQLRITEAGQITERFTRAIDQLGNENSRDVRLGGIYGLERIAKDSEPDRQAILEILCAFVREHSSKPAEKTPPDQLDDRPSLQIRAADVQATLTVIGRNEWPGRIDLIDTNLSGADLSGANLRGADLTDAKLVWANLVRADLDEAVLVGANFRWAYLDGTGAKANSVTTWPQDFGKTDEERRETAKERGVEFEE